MKLSLIAIFEELYNREDMPQVKTENIPNALKKLTEDGVEWQQIAFPCKNMKPSQKDFDKEWVKTIAQGIKNNERKFKPIVISMDDHICDGHHRFFAMLYLKLGHRRVPCIRIMLPRDEAIKAYEKASEEI